MPLIERLVNDVSNPVRFAFIAGVNGELGAVHRLDGGHEVGPARAPPLPHLTGRIDGDLLAAPTIILAAFK